MQLGIDTILWCDRLYGVEQSTDREAIQTL